MSVTFCPLCGRLPRSKPQATGAGPGSICALHREDCPFVTPVDATSAATGTSTHPAQTDTKNIEAEEVRVAAVRPIVVRAAQTAPAAKWSETVEVAPTKPILINPGSTIPTTTPNAAPTIPSAPATLPHPTHASDTTATAAQTSIPTPELADHPSAKRVGLAGQPSLKHHSFWVRQRAWVLAVSISLTVLSALGTAFIFWSGWLSLEKRMLAECKKTFSENRYRTALEQAEEFEQRFPNSPHLPMITAIRLFSSIASAIDVPRPDLATAPGRLQQFVRNTAFASFHQEYGGRELGLAQQMTDGAIQAAVRELDLTVLQQATEYQQFAAEIAERLQDPVRIEETAAFIPKIELAAGQIERGLVRRDLLDQFDQLLNAELTLAEREIAWTQLLSAHRTALRQDPSLATDTALEQRFSRWADRLKGWVQFEPMRQLPVQAALPHTVADTPANATNTLQFQEWVCLSELITSNSRRPRTVINTSAGATTTDADGLAATLPAEAEVNVSLVQGVYYALDRTGAFRWLFRGGPDATAPALVLPVTPQRPATVLITLPAAQQVWCLNASDGQVRWQQSFADPLLPTPCVLPRSAFWATAAGALFEVDLPSGLILGKFSLPSRLAVAPIYDERSQTLIAAAESQWCYFLDHNTKQCTQVLQHEHRAGALLHPPVVLGDYLILFTSHALLEGKLTVYQLPILKTRQVPLQTYTFPVHQQLDIETDGEQLAISTDRGLLSIWAANYENPNENLYYLLPPITLTPQASLAQTLGSATVPATGKVAAVPESDSSGVSSSIANRPSWERQFLSILRQNETNLWLAGNKRVQNYHVNTLKQILFPAWQPASTVGTLQNQVIYRSDADVLYCQGFDSQRTPSQCAIAAQSGELLWQRQIGYQSPLPPIHLGKYVYFLTDSGRWGQWSLPESLDRAPLPKRQLTLAPFRTTTAGTTITYATMQTAISTDQYWVMASQRQDPTKIDLLSHSLTNDPASESTPESAPDAGPDSATPDFPFVVSQLQLPAAPIAWTAQGETWYGFCQDGRLVSFDIHSGQMLVEPYYWQNVDPLAKPSETIILQPDTFQATTVSTVPIAMACDATDRVLMVERSGRAIQLQATATTPRFWQVNYQDDPQQDNHLSGPATALLLTPNQTSLYYMVREQTVTRHQIGSANPLQFTGNSSIQSAVLLAQGILLQWVDRSYTLLDLNDLQPRWHRPSRSDNNALRVGGMQPFQLDDQSGWLETYYDGKVWAFAATDGELIGEWTLPAATVPAHPAVLLDAKQILLSLIDGTLIVIKK